MRAPKGQGLTSSDSALLGALIPAIVNWYSRLVSVSI